MDMIEARTRFQELRKKGGTVAPVELDEIWAALGTVLLVVASRRATLRQVSASLLEISEQLRQLRQAPPREGGG